MCGIAGFWTKSLENSANWLENSASRMANTLVHRGPDDSGTWIDQRVGIAFGHRRLSIIDTSHAGHQPMISSDSRYVISYNGEVYSFLELRQELEKKGHSFKGQSDTEVMLASFVEWGVEASLERFDGMFAFAVWDRRDRLLWLARDRIGEKPLYYGTQNGTLFIASELKAIRAHPHFKPRIDRNALASYLRFSYVPAPYSIYQGIKKLLPGHLICFKSSMDSIEPQPYWSLNKVMKNGIKNPLIGSEEEIADELEKRLRETVKSRMISDVPLGAFLSGGIDSSTIVALMQSQSHRPVNTFTIGFHEQKFNEALYAKKVADHLGTNHTELYISSKEAMEVIPKLPEMYDEPFADSSQIPTHLISKLARRDVTVALSGDGGDELFLGYNRYFVGQKLWKVLPHIPKVLRKRSGKFLNDFGIKSIEGVYGKIEKMLPKKMNIPHSTEKLKKLANILEGGSNPQEIYKRIVSIIQRPEIFVKSGEEFTTTIDDGSHWEEINEIMLTMVYLDLVTYHPEDILQKVDRASMAVSLETRVPFLDKNLIEFIMRIPLEMKINRQSNKLILKKILYRYLPKNLMERRKMGFSIPVGEWVKGPMKDWAESLINNNTTEDYFINEMVNDMWKNHIKEKSTHSHELWNILMFKAWQEEVKRL